MKAVKGYYDGKVVKPNEPLNTKPDSEVIIVFQEWLLNKNASREARRRLRGSGKGENLTEKLLKSRSEDLEIEGKGGTR
jgi:hypothetical protein